MAALVGVAGKTVFEQVSGHALFVTGNDAVSVSVASHVFGVLVALVFYGVERMRNWRLESRQHRQAGKPALRRNGTAFRTGF